MRAPIVQIELLEGRPVERKRALAEKETRAITVAVNCPVEAVSIIICDMPRENCAQAGMLAADRK